MCDDFWQCKYCGNWEKDVTEICQKCWRDKSGYSENCDFVKIHSWWSLPGDIPAFCGNCGHYFGNIYDTQNIPYYQCPKCYYINVDDIGFWKNKYRGD